MFTAAPGTIIVYGDIACPWSHLAVHRLWTTRERLGLQDRVLLDPRAFPLELFNERATPKASLDAELPVAGGLDPSAGWHTWDRAIWEYPGTTLLALEAVQAAKRQSRAAAEQLDRALRTAFFRDRRNISLRHEIARAAEAADRVDHALLLEDLDSGTARRTVMDQKAAAEDGRVKGSPHLFLPDGSDVHNPGIELHWEEGRFPVIDKDDPSIYEELLERAA
jgi:predicted DsbA family dithiol-disulfide isomerase